MRGIHIENIDYAVDTSVASHNPTTLEVNNVSQIANFERKLSVEVNIRSNNTCPGHRIKHSDNLCLFCYIKRYESRRYKMKSAFDFQCLIYCRIGHWYTKKLINDTKGYPFINALKFLKPLQPWVLNLKIWIHKIQYPNYTLELIL